MAVSREVEEQVKQFEGAASSSAYGRDGIRHIESQGRVKKIDTMYYMRLHRQGISHSKRTTYASMVCREEKLAEISRDSRAELLEVARSTLRERVQEAGAEAAGNGAPSTNSKSREH